MFLPGNLKHLTSALLCALPALTSASPEQKPAYSITAPTRDAILTPNTPSVISWATTQRSNTQLSIHLATTSNNTSLCTIATNISNSGSISWSPPARIPSGSEYIIVLDPATTSNTINTTSSSSSSDDNNPEEPKHYQSNPFTITAPKSTPRNKTSTTGGNSTEMATTYYPTENQRLTRGKTAIVTWPVAQDKKTAQVSVYLMEGGGGASSASDEEKNVSSVARHVANSGSLACVLPGNLTVADDYRFAIVEGEGEVQYSARFRVVSEDEDEDVDAVKESKEEDVGASADESGGVATNATSTSSGWASGSTEALKSDSTWIATAAGSRVVGCGGWTALGMMVVLLVV
ncbi:uncharacterized protein BP01DRAFT_132711 [Aspergillus saccharolyticus JOP 1030-1]|uniref:Yeast cell wall synthesis Kre9/Knh1-like N-terminal domain-containing protein n=1 Tax=Aspergillus saccharolyticus JOP 1030-1 TaxID=1450539 RepID=A0A318Z7Q6_9EURO|nr:hypothetical protein BP01DRAFT_132711 [Aspergillus saccharolyticus JOP 1030-1]PYH42464.1 hypothetical protein BP01DRAFT_132711 [Aspergillus saccharolyticus JOP 1030-1]